MTNEELRILNKRLAERFGETGGVPTWRVVRGDYTHKRFGAFNEWYGPIFLREFVGLKEIEKYDWLDPRQYVLEKYMWTLEAGLFGNDRVMDYEGPIYVWPPERLVGVDEQARCFSFCERVFLTCILTLENGVQTTMGQAVSEIQARRQIRNEQRYDEYAGKIFEEHDRDKLSPYWRTRNRVTNSRIVTATK